MSEDNTSGKRPEKNFYLLYLRATAELGELGSSLIVNAHRYNSVDPRDIKSKIAQINHTLEKLLNDYEKKFCNTTFRMEH